MENLSEQDLEKLAEKVIEILNLNHQHTLKQGISKVTKKYHWDLYNKFGATGTMESAIRTTALLLAGYRTVKDLPADKVDEVCEYMELFYENILRDKREYVVAKKS